MKTKLSIILASLAMAFSVGAGVAATKGKAVQEVEPAEAAAKYTQTVNQYYSNSQQSGDTGFSWDLTGSALKTKLFNKIKITTAGWSYDGLWECYLTSDTRSDGTLWDIYADWTKYTTSSPHSNYSKEGDAVNREHMIPQGSFNEAAPMKSDAHHVLPSDGYVNNRRGSFPHGIVTGTPDYTSKDGCKLGTGTGSTTVFEPMDEYKGDIARIYFYFVTCYQDKLGSNSFSGFDKSTYPSIKTAFLNVYLQWAKDDPVSEKEIARNNAIYAGQGNRNPFIDCPYAVGAIWDSTHASDYGVKGEYTSGEGVSISKSTASMLTGGTTTISASSTAGGTINWTTSNSNVVSLSSSTSSSGNYITLTAGSAGSATVTASQTISGHNYSKECTVTVSSTKQVVSISISGEKTSYSVGDSFVKPTVTATYNDDTQSTVTNDANCTGYNMSTAGNYTVTVSYSYGGVNKTTTYQITVSASGSGDGSFSFTPSSKSAGTLDDAPTGFSYSFANTYNNANQITKNNSMTLTISTSSNTEYYITGITLSAKTNSGSGAGTATAKIGNTTIGTYTYSQSGTYQDRDLTMQSAATTTKFNKTSNLSVVLSCSTNSIYCNKFTFTYEIYSPKTLTDISISTEPTKSVYTEGETFDPTGLVIGRQYSDASSNTYAYAGHTSEFTFVPSLSTPLTVEDESIEIIYSNLSVFFEIDVQPELVLSSISISGYTTSFSEGDTFTFGGTVTAHYTDSSSADVTSSAVFTGYDLTSLGNQTVTVTYGGLSQTYGITVSAGTLSSIVVSGQTTSYSRSASFSFDGVCTATFANGYQKEVTPTEVTSPNMSVPGNKSITVSYTYNGKTKTTSYQITVASSRVVMEESNVSSTITWPESAEANVSGTLSATVANGQCTHYEDGDDDKALRLGTGSGGGDMTIQTQTNILTVTIRAKAYTSSYTGTLSVGSQSINVTNYDSYTTFNTITLSNPTKTLSISTGSKYVRICIQQITITSIADVDIGQTSDCIGLETFITNYMHMDYTENLGYCNDSTHHYYSTAKTAFNQLNTHQRSLFTGNSAFSVEWERLSTWASIVGDSLNSSNILASGLNQNHTSSFITNDATTIIIIIGVVALFALGGYVFIRKRKES